MGLAMEYMGDESKCGGWTRVSMDAVPKIVSRIVQSGEIQVLATESLVILQA
jgi:hypothetical protein